jgi:hypothetical protein
VTSTRVSTRHAWWRALHFLGRYFFAVCMVAFGVLAGLSIITRWQMRLASFLLGLKFLLWVVVVHAPRIAASPHNGNEWNSALVALAICGVAG